MRLLPYDWEFGLFPVVSGMVHSAFAAPRSPLTLQPARLLHAMCPSSERVHTRAATNAEAGAQLGAAPGRYTNPRTCLPHALSVGPPSSVHSVPRLSAWVTLRKGEVFKER